jgi:hypothetical protein
MHGRLLVAYSNASNFVSTTAEYLESLGKYCDLEVRYAHVTNGAKLDFDLNEFDAVFQSYCVRLPVDNYVSSSYIEQMKTFRGIKMLAAQDEYENTDKLKSGMLDIGYDVFFTNASGDMIERLYPRKEFTKTEFITVLTGYVPEAFASRANAPRLRDRPIHIGYRCRQLPAYYGRLGFEKFEIGRRVREACVARGIPHDIEWTDDKRLYGDAWYDFIGSCRANLGSETGSNVFDFDGALRAKYEELSVARGDAVPFEEFRAYTDPIEARYDIGQVSPRIFEAAAMRTPLILFSGKYLGIIKPDEHYIELKKDFSNIDAVLTRLDDLDALERMAERAYDRLVGSGEFSYRRFAGLVEEAIRRKATERGITLRPPTRRLGPTEFGVQLVGLAEFREMPTATPRNPVFFFYQNLASQNAHLTRELDRLNEYYTERIVYLNDYIREHSDLLTKEIERLNEYYPERIAYLNNYIAERVAELNAHIAQQNENFIKEIDRLKAIISDNRARRGAAAVLDGTGTVRGAIGSALYRLVTNARMRQLVRLVMARLPDRLGRRIKSRVGPLLDRL